MVASVARAKMRTVERTEGPRQGTDRGVTKLIVARTAKGCRQTVGATNLGNVTVPAKAREGTNGVTVDAADRRGGLDIAADLWRCVERVTRIELA